MSENKVQEDTSYNNKAQKKKKRWWLKLLKGVIIAFCLFWGLLLGIVVMVPHTVSTEWFRKTVENQGSQFLNRPLHLENLTWTWSYGIVIESFEIEDDPSFSSKPLVFFKKLLLDIDYKELLHKRLVFNFTLNGLTIQFIRNKQGITNLNALMSQFPAKPPSEEKPQKEKEPFDFRTFSLPLDIETHIHLTNLSLSMNDRSQNRNLRISNGLILIDTNSVINEPAEMKILADIELDGKNFSAFEFNAIAEKAFTSEGLLNIQEAVVMADAAFPGIKLMLRAEPGKNKLQSNLDIVFNETMDVVRPFLPHPLSETAIKGNLALRINVSTELRQKFNFLITLQGENIALSGGIIDNKSIGPFMVNIENQGFFDISDGKVALEKGRISLPGNSLILFSARTDNVFEPQSKIDFKLGPVSLDLKELYTLAEPFIPPTLSLTPDGDSHVLTLGELHVTGTPPGPIDITVSDLALNLSDISIKNSDLTLSLEDGKKTHSMTLRLQEAGFSGALPSGSDNLVKASIHNLELYFGNLSVKNLDRTLSLKGGKKTHSMTLRLQEAGFSGALPSGSDNPVRATIHNLVLNLSDISVKNSDLTLSLESGEKTHSMTVKLQDAGFSKELLSGSDLVKAAINNVELNLGNLSVKNPDLTLSLESGKKTHSMTIKLQDAGFSKELLSGSDLVKAAINNVELNLGNLSAKNPDLTLSLENGKKAYSMTLILQDAAFSGALPPGSDSLKVNNIVLEVPVLNVKAKKTDMSLLNLQKSIKTIDLSLKDLFPRNAFLEFTFNVEKADIRGSPAITVDNFDIPPVKITVHNITQNDKALFGISSGVNLKQSSNISRASLTSPALNMKGFKQSLDIDVNLPPRPEAEIFVNKLALSSSSVSVKVPGASEALTTDLDFTSSTDRVSLKGLNPLVLNITDLNSSLSSGKFLKLTVAADAENMGNDYVRLQSEIDVNLRELMKILPSQLGSLIKVSNLSGIIRLLLTFSGRLPAEKELEKLKGKTLSDKTEALEFLKDLDLSVFAKNINARLPLAKGQGLTISDFSTKSPLTLSLISGVKKGSLKGSFNARIEDLPALKPMKRPLDVFLDVSVNNESISALKVSEALEIEPLNLKQDAKITLTGLNRVLDRDLKNIIPLFLRHVRGDISTTVELEKGADLSFVRDNMDVKGRLEAGAEVHLIPRQDITLRGWMKSPHMDIKLERLMTVNNLQSHLVLEKNYKIVDRLALSGQTREKRSRTLSDDVLNPLRASPSMAQSGQKLIQRLMQDMRGRFREHRSLSFDSARITGKPLPLEFTNQALDFRLDEGLPVVDYFQIDILGGTLVCTFSLRWRDGEFYLNLMAAFSGINTKKLAPRIVHDVSEKEAEISGQMSLSFPLSVDMKSILQSLELDFEITDIGSRTLERFLFALDPYESNENIIKQRKYLRLGTPRWIKIFIKYGNLDMTGEVSVKGINIDLPAIRRLDVGNLPGIETLENQLMSLEGVIDLLKYLASDAVGVDRNNNVIFLYKGRQIQQLSR
jgi:uncharacterized protein YjbI with pentapeptide repeats